MWGPARPPEGYSELEGSLQCQGACMLPLDSVGLLTSEFAMEGGPWAFLLPFLVVSSRASYHMAVARCGARVASVGLR